MTNGLPNENRNTSREKTVFAPPLWGQYTALGVGLILVGSLMLYNRIYHSLYRMELIPQWVYRLLQEVPSAVMALGFIILGAWLVWAKRTHADTAEERSPYREGGKGKES